MIGGTHRHRLDKKDYSLHRSFPRFGMVVPGPLEDREYSYDIGLFMPNQLAPDLRFNPPLPALFQGCTGETTTDIWGDIDECAYDPEYTYRGTCDIEGHGYDQGCDIRDSMGSPASIGLRKDGETIAQARQRKRGPYFVIDRVPGRDWFDSFRLALRGNGRSISMGSPWFSIFEEVDSTGLLSADFEYTEEGYGVNYEWHNSKVCGEKTLGGEPTLVVKSWQGRLYGDGGWVYMNRETFNKTFDIDGTIGATPGSRTLAPADVKRIQISLLQQMIIVINKLLAIANLKQIQIYA